MNIYCEHQIFERPKGVMLAITVMYTSF